VRRKVGLVCLPIVRSGAAAIRNEFEQLKARGIGYAVVDAVADADLMTIGAACADLPLVTGGSGIALGLAPNFASRSSQPPATEDAELPDVGGGAAVLAGSCSAATRSQVEAWSKQYPSIALVPTASDDAATLAARCVEAATVHLAASRPFLVYSTATTSEVARVQSLLGREHAAALIEDAFARISRQLVARGVRRLVVAGGETSGAVVQALGIAALAIGPQIEPGVPWTTTLAKPRLALALKSGNFGSVDFFAKALDMLPS
jgi:uncharacterized protein YgbK (DUF1537 family)